MFELGRRRAVVPALIALGLATVPLTAQEVANVPASAATQQREITTTLLRTWTSDDVTIVDGLSQVPLSIMAGGTTGAYRFELAVFDSTGTQLLRDSWERNLSQRAAAYTQAESSTMLEPFRFGVRPGRYEVEIRAYPTDAPDLGATTRIPIEAYEARPVASDLFLADRVEQLDEEAGGSWSISHGGFGISATARTTVLPQEPRLFYYIELYGAEAETSYEVSASVVQPGGRTVYETPSSTRAVPEGGLPFAGSLTLAGLPPGEYHLRLEVAGRADGADAATVREAPFRMLDAAAAQPMMPTSYEGQYFASLSDAELKANFDGVGYLVTESERQAFNSLPPDAKRRYLTEFFASRNPTMGGQSNPFLEEYLERVGTARMKYGQLVGTGERPPWSTDPGRIYLQYGEPDERVVNHFPSGADMRASGGVSQGEAPYEIWGYHSTGYIYLFVQESAMNAWRMIFTNDPNRQSVADWRERIGAEAVRDMQMKFGF